jgi:hypothetical protein
MAGMECDIRILAAFESDLLLLIVQLIVPHEDIRGRATSTRADRTNNFANLHNCIRRLVQLNLELL